MRAIRHVPVVLVALGTVACTALLGDFNVGGAGSSGGPGVEAGAEGGGEGGAVGIMPTEAKVGIFRAQVFTAATDVTWSVMEGPAGGKVDAKGKYIAPEKPGIYHVVAASKASPALTSTSTVTVVPLGINVLVGRPGGPGTIDGPVTKARLRNPGGIALLRGSGGNDITIIADTGNNTIRKISNGVVTTLAGTPGLAGTVDGVGAAARFDGPTNVVADDNGKKVWISDSKNACIRKIDVDTGAVTTFAGKCGTSGHQDSTDGTGATALFGGIDSLVLGSQKDSLYVCDIGNFRGIRRIDATTGKTSSPITGFNNSCTMAADYFSHRLYYNDNFNTNDIGYFNDPVGGIQPGAVRTSICPASPFSSFSSMTAATGFGGENDIYITSRSQSGGIYRCDLGTNKWDVAPIAGSATEFQVKDGTLADARFASPTGLTVNPGFGELYLVDGNTARRIRTGPGGTVATIAGLPSNDLRIDGPGTVARLTGPFGIAADDAGNPFIGDLGLDRILNNTVRKFDVASGTLSTVAGAPSRFDPTLPPVDGPKDQAKFGIPWDMLVIGGDVYVLDIFAQAVRKVTIATGEVKTIAGELNVPGKSDGVGAAAHFNFYDQMSNSSTVGAGIATDGTNLFISDGANFAIRKIAIATGTVTTLAGGTKGPMNGVGAQAQFVSPGGLAFVDGVLYIADLGDHTIRKVDPATGAVTGFFGFSGQFGDVDGDASKAMLNFPGRIAADGNGNLFLAETPSVQSGSPAIRRIDLNTKTISPFAGTAGQRGFSSGPLPATVNCPSGLAVTKNGDLLFGDSCDGVVAVVQPL
ncbi:MAG: hypothetical protein JWO86_6579 [Myxococcaceae bacterium]|nr:hypothetical protein [Myxococcaceae bacterium]